MMIAHLSYQILNINDYRNVIDYISVKFFISGINQIILENIIFNIIYLDEISHTDLPQIDF